LTFAVKLNSQNLKIEILAASKLNSRFLMFQSERERKRDTHEILLICSNSLLFFISLQCVCSVTKQQKKRKWGRERDSSKQFQALGWVCVSNGKEEKKKLKNKLQVVCKQKCWLNLLQKKTRKEWKRDKSDLTFLWQILWLFVALMHVRFSSSLLLIAKRLFMECSLSDARKLLRNLFLKFLWRV
jgi:hypothetical protein